MNSARRNTPEYEITQRRDESVFYFEHGYPNTLVRWHYHDDYELHYIAKSSGKVFVGDYIGQFHPGNLVLMGPRLPHNWISHIEPNERIHIRDMVVQFNQHVVHDMAKAAPELSELLPMLDRARYGIEFREISTEAAKDYMLRIRDSQGVAKVSLLLEFLQLLGKESEYKLLSTASMKCNVDEPSMKKIHQVVKYVTDNHAQAVTLVTVADLVGMSHSAFSRFFTKATGNGFNEFLNRVRVSRACELLSQTDQPITSICYEVGFNNVAHFNRRFRRIKNITPREYRQEMQCRANIVR